MAPTQICVCSIGSLRPSWPKQIERSLTSAFWSPPIFAATGRNIEKQKPQRTVRWLSPNLLSSISVYLFLVSHLYTSLGLTPLHSLFGLSLATYVFDCLRCVVFNLFSICVSVLGLDSLSLLSFTLFYFYLRLYFLFVCYLVSFYLCLWFSNDLVNLSHSPLCAVFGPRLPPLFLLMSFELLFVLLRMGQKRPLFCLFSSFQRVTILIKLIKV